MAFDPRRTASGRRDAVGFQPRDGDEQKVRLASTRVEADSLDLPAVSVNLQDIDLFSSSSKSTSASQSSVLKDTAHNRLPLSGVPGAGFWLEAQPLPVTFISRPFSWAAFRACRTVIPRKSVRRPPLPLQRLEPSAHCGVDTSRILEPVLISVSWTGRLPMSGSKQRMICWEMDLNTGAAASPPHLCSWGSSMETSMTKRGASAGKSP